MDYHSNGSQFQAVVSSQLANRPARVAVLLPCLNEAGAIGEVVRRFRTTLPQAEIYVFDNGSEDDTAQVAQAAGAIVCQEPRRGKGNVVARMFSDVDADVYVLADGDGTYDVAKAPELVNLLVQQNLDMVVGCRTPISRQVTYRPGHQFGNRLITGAVTTIFGRGFTDILSGYRCFSRRFVKSFPALSRGFEIETELTVHALSLNLPTAEIQTDYAERAGGTTSKLNTYRDGLRIGRMILRLLRDYRPLSFFGWIGFLLVLLSLVIAAPVLLEYARTGLVPRLPTAVLATGLMLSAIMSFVTGLTLDSVARGFLELRRLSYLAQAKSLNRDS